MSKLIVSIVVNMDIMHEIVQKHVIMLILLKKVRKEVKNMLDLDNSSVSEECAMMCTEVQYEDGDEGLVVYGDQGIGTEEHQKAKYENPK